MPQDEPSPASTPPPASAGGRMQRVWPMAFVASMCVLGAFIFLKTWGHWDSANQLQFICYLTLAVLASGLKVGLPSLRGTMSVAFLFTLIGIEELSLPETLVIACASTLVQCLWHAKRRPKLIQITFNVACIAVAADICWRMCHWQTLRILVVGA